MLIRGNTVTVACYFDDLITIARNQDKCKCNVSKIITVLDFLWFEVHQDKSVLILTQKLKQFGFIIDSNTMTVTLTKSKKQNIVDCCRLALSSEKIKIR